MNALADLAGRFMPHLMLAPIALPLFTATLTLLMREERQRVKLGLNMVSTALGLLVAVALLAWAHLADTPEGMGVYLQGNWAAPFGIVLVLDRLSAMMLVLTSVLALCAIVFAGTRWHRAGVHFHTLYQLQLMGLSGAFLTGDLFNLFVFFEIMLAASYGLLLHGSGRARVQSGLHYIAINLAASLLFLIGASMLYGITGTLNMADLARAVPLVSQADQGLLHAAAGILATAFLIKAAVWPLNFWLVPAYSAATAPVGALFAVMTKVGIYTLLRLWTLMFGAEAGDSALFGGLWLVGAGMATMAFGGVGMLAAQRPVHLAGFAAVLSSGTVLAASGFGQNALTAALLYYLPGSTLAVGALFMLADLIERWRTAGTPLSAHDSEDAPFLTAELLPTPGLNLDDDDGDDDALVGRVIPAAAAMLGIAWMVCTLVITGMPPLSGFVGKFAMLTAVLNPLGLGPSAGIQPGWNGWLMLALLIGTGLLSLLAMTRTGMRHFWAASGRVTPRLHALEGLPVAALLAACVALTLWAEPVMRFTQAAANALYAPDVYIRAVLQAQPRPSPSPASAALPPDGAAR